jgi:hypothetical protein
VPCDAVLNALSFMRLVLPCKFILVHAAPRAAWL